MEIDKIRKLEEISKKIEKRKKEFLDCKAFLNKLIHTRNLLPPDAPLTERERAERHVQYTQDDVSLAFKLIRWDLERYIDLLPEEMRRTKKKLFKLLGLAVQWEVGLHLPKEQKEIEVFIAKYSQIK